MVHIVLYRMVTITAITMVAVDAAMYQNALLLRSWLRQKTTLMS